MAFPRRSKAVLHLLALFLAAWASQFQSLATEEHDISIDIVFALDTACAIPNIFLLYHRRIPPVIDQLKKNFRDVHAGLVTFNDRSTACDPKSTYGHANFCARVDLPVTDDMARFLVYMWRFPTTVKPDGADGRRDALGALLVSALGPVEWRPAEKNRVRVVVLVTDAFYRNEADDANAVCPGPNMRPNDGDGDYDCLNENYPTVDQVKEALTKKNIVPVFVVPPVLRELYNELGYSLGWGGSAREMRDDFSDIAFSVRRSVESAVDAQVSDIGILPEGPFPLETPPAPGEVEAPGAEAEEGRRGGGGTIAVGAATGVVVVAGLASYGIYKYATQPAEPPEAGGFAPDERYMREPEEKETAVHLEEDVYA